MCPLTIIIIIIIITSNIIISKNDDVTGKSRRLQNEELYDLYSSPSIIRLIKSVRIRREGHVASLGEGEGHVGYWWNTLRERDHLEDLGVEGCVILKWIFKKWNREAWTGLIWLRIGTGGRCL